jgi:hypothetical protein
MAKDFNSFGTTPWRVARRNWAARPLHFDAALSLSDESFAVLPS